MLLLISLLLSQANATVCMNLINLSDATLMCSGVNPGKPFYKCDEKDCVCIDGIKMDYCKIVNKAIVQDDAKKISYDAAKAVEEQAKEQKQDDIDTSKQDLLNAKDSDEKLNAIINYLKVRDGI